MDYIISEEELMKFNAFYDVKNYLKSLQPVKTLDRDKVEGTIRCECKECDFNKDLECMQSFITVDNYDDDDTTTHINNLKKTESEVIPYRILIDKDGCNVWHDKWDYIENMDRTD